jgi:hypothetical protein
MIPHRYNIREKNLLEGQVGNWIFLLYVVQTLFHYIGLYIKIVQSLNLK